VDKINFSLVLPVPNSKNWEESENNFRHKWDFPNCVDAIDGKHVVIQVSFNNYKTQILVVILKAVTEIFMINYCILSIKHFLRKDTQII